MSLAKFLSGSDGGTPWYVILGAVIAVVVAALPLIVALWKGFHKNYDGEVAVKYKNGKPVQKRFGEHQGETLLRGAGLRFAMWGTGEWRKMTSSDQTTDEAECEIDLADGTQVKIKVSFVYGLLEQPLDAWYLPEHVHLVRYMRAIQGEFESIVRLRFLSKIAAAIRTNRLTLAEITPESAFVIVGREATAWFTTRGGVLREINLSVAKTQAQKLSELSVSRTTGVLSTMI